MDGAVNGGPDALEDAGSHISESLEELDTHNEPPPATLVAKPHSSEDPQMPNLDPERTDALVDEIVKFLEGNG